MFQFLISKYKQGETIRGIPKKEIKFNFFEFPHSNFYDELDTSLKFWLTIIETKIIQDEIWYKCVLGFNKQNSKVLFGWVPDDRKNHKFPMFFRNNKICFESVGNLL